MSGWRPLPRIAFAVCIYPFQPSSPADLPLEIGDELYIIERGGKDGAWFRGYLVAPPSLLAGLTSVKGETLQARVFSGIFPRCCVEVREVLGDGNNSEGAENTNRRSFESSARPLTGSSHGEIRVNGVATPAENMSPISRSKGSLRRSKSGSKTDSSTLNHQGPTNLGNEKSGRRSRKRQGSQGSQWTSRSDHIQQFLMPLSPASVVPRDPSAPRPIAPVPMLKVGDETPTSIQEPLVDEIASCLREWHSTKLHELLLTRRYSDLDKMSLLVRKLDTARRQFLHNVLTAKELQELRETTVWNLVNGNKMFSGEVIVRDPSRKGRILTSEDSAIEITRLQSMMSLLEEKPAQLPDEHILHHILVQLKNIAVIGMHSATQVSIFLGRKAPGEDIKSLSEVFLVDLVNKDGSVAQLPADRMKTLFAELSSSDIGEGAGTGTELFIIFKLSSSVPQKMSTWTYVDTETARGSSTSLTSHANQPGGGLKTGRRSAMFGSIRRKDGDPPSRGLSFRPESRGSTRSRAESRPDASPPTLNPPKEAKYLKRNIAIGALRVDELIRTSAELEHDITLWAPASSFDESAETEGSYEKIIEEILPSSTGKYTKLPSVSQLQIFVKGFANADTDLLVRTTPTLLHEVFLTRKIGFPGAPTRPRSDIYLTLSEALFPKNAFLSHPKTGTTPLPQQFSFANLQLTIEVRRSNGERIEGCIHPSQNNTGHTAWRTTAVERGEPWNVTVRLAIPPDDVPGSHIIMSVADAPEFPFALCWMPLWPHDAFVRDGEHSLALYRYDEHTSGLVSGRHAYLSLPWSSKRKDESVVGPLASLRLQTYLCSTKYSQDPNLLGLLKWRDQGPGQLTNLLQRFTFVPAIEIVKLLNEVFDALFEILVEYAGGDEYEDLVFNALVIVLGIVHDRRFNLKALVDQYAENRFNYPFATSCLIRSFTRMLEKPTDPDISRKLRASFKVGAHIFKFIMSAREQQKEKEAEIGITNRTPSFAKEVLGIFKAFCALMGNPAPILVGTKTLLVQHFHTWLPELHPLMTQKQILQVASKFIEACSDVQGKLVLYKLVFIVHLINLETLKSPETRQILRQNTVRWITPYWGRTDTANEQYRDQVRLCCSAVASLVDELGQEAYDYIPKLVDSYWAIKATPHTPKQSLSLLFPTTYPFPFKSTSPGTECDEALVEISALLAALSNAPNIIHHDSSKTDTTEFLSKILQVFISILNGDAFPSSWLSVRIFHHKSIIRSLENIASILFDSFLPFPDDADQFNTELWRSFFDALLKLVGSEALALETFPEQKRRAVWKIAGDVRELGADLIHRSWEAIGWETSAEDRKQYGLEKMGGFQVQYVPGLVAPIVELCLSVHEELRGVAIEVLQTMIISEWTLSQDLALIQAEMIDCLDHLFKTRHLTENVIQKRFVRELIDLFEPLSHDPEDVFFTAIDSLISTIDELLDLLVAVHTTEAKGEVFHLMDTLTLMEFLKDVEKEDIYINYVHQLAQLQAEAGNFTEAGLALRLHAELYAWDPSFMVEKIEELSLPAQNAFERKENLFFQIIKYFEEGLSWDNALAAYIELAAQYEHNIFDFAKLARTQRAMATIYESISKGERQNPRYFRVVYKGLGFPTGLRDKQFVFEGVPGDRLASFTDRMRQQHPSAQILAHGDEEDVEGQYLQIFAVSPQKSLMHPIYQRSKVNQAVRDYHLLSRPKQFTASNRKQLDSHAKDQQLERTVYSVADAFPNILRRSEIVSVGTETLSQIESAVERTTRKTAELGVLERKAADGEDSSLTPITEVLSTTFDATSSSSIALYRELLPKPRESTIGSILDEEEEEPPQLNNLEIALRIAILDYVLTAKRCLALYRRPAQQATRMELTKRTSGPMQNS